LLVIEVWLQSSLLGQISVVVAWLALVALLAVTLHHRTQDPEIPRKVVHIGTGNIILLAWWLQVPAWVGISAALLFGLITLTSYWVPILPALESVGRRSLGTFFYAMSFGLLIAWFWPPHLPRYAALGILTMTWGDGFAALVGQRFGRHHYRIGDIQKSWEGSLTMAVVTMLVAGFMLWSVVGSPWQIGAISLAIASVATGLEAFSWWGLDNLTVPVASAALAYLLSEFILPLGS